ncbi:hypothetical protein [Cellulomonas sp. NTE-D12]|uniref:hypothetical protein n=1 Tax=Cellulomonas sp. NTE-D12 TaxID=2962632 RepID=UPI00308145C4|nr:hypothetical protein CELD12_31490 [Cellulomonas sp. NTE-D12]
MSLQRRLVGRLVLGSSVAAIAVVLAGCGSSAPQAAATAAAASEAVVTPTPTPTPTPTAVYTLTTATFAQAMQAAAAKATSCTFTLQVATNGQTITADGALRVLPDKTSEMAMKMTASSTGAIDLRVVAGTWYISGGELTGGKFVKGDPKDPKGPFAGMAGVFDSVNPNQGMAAFQDAIVSVTPVGGTEQVGGVPTQAYDVVVDTTKLSAAVRSQQFDEQTALPAQITYRYWFGADGLVRKMTSDVQGEQQVMTFSGWGQPVDIQAPPASQVVTLK